MKVELKSIKYAEFASEETACFSATVWIDGAKAGTVSNDGQGGCNDYHPFSLGEKLNAYAATLPPKVDPEIIDPATGRGFEYTPDADTVVGELLDDHLLAKRLRALLRDRIVFVSTDGAIYTLKRQSAAELAVRLRTPGLEGKIKNCRTILNKLEWDVAFAAFKAAA